MKVVMALNFNNAGYACVKEIVRNVIFNGSRFNTKVICETDTN